MIPALVVDREGRRALVYSQGTVVEISLDDLTATTHAVSEPVSVWRRFRDWLEPEAQAKIVEGYYRSGEWIGDGRFAVSGMDFSEEKARPRDSRSSTRRAGRSARSPTEPRSSR